MNHTTHPPAADAAGSPTEPAIREPLDFSKYRTGELVGKLTEIISIGGNLQFVARTLALLSTVIYLVLIAACILADRSLLEFLAIGAYCLLVSLIFGFVLGLLRVVHRSLDSTEEVVTILLSNSAAAAKDIAAIRSGDLAMPSPRQIVRQMYEQVIFPSIEEAVAGGLGLLGRPLLWLYRLTFGSIVNKLLLTGELEKCGLAEEMAGARDEDADMVMLDAASEQLEAAKPALKYMQAAKQICKRSSHALRRYAMLPFRIAFWLGLTISLLPVAAYLFMGW